jgi:hypothetical protein
MASIAMDKTAVDVWVIPVARALESAWPFFIPLEGFDA